MRGTAGKRKTGLALLKQLAMLYAQGTPNTLRVMLYKKNIPPFLGFGIIFETYVQFISKFQKLYQI